MATIGQYATEPVYMEDHNGVRRLVAAPGDPIPTTVPVFGIVTAEDPGVLTTPIAGYDSLTEEQVLEILPSLGEDDLEQVRAYERARLARGSIHRYGLVSEVVRSSGRPARVLPAQATAEGYDSMSDDDLAVELERRALVVSDEGTKAKVRKARIVALQADDAKVDTTNAAQPAV